MPTLILSSRHTPDNQAIWRAATARGWAVERAKGPRAPEVTGRPVVLYVESLYARSIANALDLELMEPADDWLVRLPHEYVQRRIELETLGEARRRDGPIFVKPAKDKLFEARIFASGEDLPRDYDDDLAVLVSETVTFEVEFRCFVLNGEVVTMSPYLRAGVLASETDFELPDTERAEALQLAERLLADRSVDCPPAFVLDVGRESERGWIVVEANPAWGSGIYGCNPDAVLIVLERSVQAREIA